MTSGADSLSRGLAAPRARAARPLGGYATALLLGLLIAGAYVALVAPTTYAFRDPDSSYYVEAARSLLAGRGLMVSTDLARLPAATEPIALWPPAYPALIALVAKLSGLDPAVVAPKIAWTAWALLPAALLLTLRPLLSDRAIHLVGAAAMIAPGAVDFAWQPMTDAPYLLLTILSLGLLFRGLDGRARPATLVLSGVLAGLAYATRNVALAILPAAGAAFAVLLLRRAPGPQAVAARAAWWAAGLAIPLVPLEARNLLVFGGLQPYEMAPSTVGLFANVRYFVAAQANDLAAVHGLIDRIVWSNAVVFGAPLAAAALLGLWRKRVFAAWAGLSPMGRAAAAALIAYALANAAVVIAARTRYEWGEFIGLRHLLQTDWVLLAGAALLIEARPLSRQAAALAAAAFAALLAIRISYAAGELAMQRQESAAAERPVELAAGGGPASAYRYRLAVKLAIARDRPLAEAIRDLPADAVILSNYDDVVRVVAGRTAHPLAIDARCDLRPALDRARTSAAPVVMLVFARRELLKSGCWERLNRAPSGPKRLGVSRPYLASFSY